ncbi:hypothetical protein [Candidatus Liberibacter sp.]|uniref:hypothetical protein n=1 Tax=Candidatus Liberibacter sp. TaxID=34022 RepID=UPI0015F6E0A3|nr:hypothetical protein [Candidatus Liberibacter sp.]MBA5724210.1 hypothetical protein [Candidatus Liberibacter sp.]
MRKNIKTSSQKEFDALQAKLDSLQEVVDDKLSKIEDNINKHLKGRLALMLMAGSILLNKARRRLCGVFLLRIILYT